MIENFRTYPTKLESEIDPDFTYLIQERAGDDHLLTCIQCGTCSGTCPSANYMEHSPRQVIAMVKSGFKNEVLTSLSPWLCASCYSCMVQCPKQIKITEVMYAIKQTALELKTYPKRFPSPVMVQEFFNSVIKRGRIHEGMLIFKLFLKTNRIQFIKQGLFGFNMWRKGLIHILPSSVKQKKDIDKMLKAMDSHSA